MFEQILARAQALAEARRKAQRERLASEVPPPPGVTITPTDEGIVLSGKRLRRRLVTDAKLRSFGR